MLNVKDLNEEFEMKTKCLRRKSADFERERARWDSEEGVVDALVDEGMRAEIKIRHGKSIMVKKRANEI